jgi:hypothetical protein
VIANRIQDKVAVITGENSYPPPQWTSPSYLDTGLRQWACFTYCIARIPSA